MSEEINIPKIVLDRWWHILNEAHVCTIPFILDFERMKEQAIIKRSGMISEIKDEIESVLDGYIPQK